MISSGAKKLPGSPQSSETLGLRDLSEGIRPCGMAGPGEDAGTLLNLSNMEVMDATEVNTFSYTNYPH